jgi:hypothetical protein
MPAATRTLARALEALPVVWIINPDLTIKGTCWDLERSIVPIIILLSFYQE